MGELPARNDKARVTSAGDASQVRGPVPALVSVSKSTRALLGLLLADAGLFYGQDHLLIMLEADPPETVTSLANAIGSAPRQCRRWSPGLPREAW